MTNASRKVIEKESGGANAFGWMRADEYRGGSFLSNKEAVEYAQARTVFYVTEVSAPEDGFKGATKRIVTLSRDGDVDVQKSFDIKNAEGDAVFAGRALMLSDFADHLDDGGEPIAVRFVEAGTGVTFEPAIAVIADEEDEAPFPTEEPEQE